jgi:hypothetical protein
MIDNSIKGDGLWLAKHPEFPKHELVWKHGEWLLLFGTDNVWPVNSYNLIRFIDVPELYLKLGTEE